MTAPGRGPYTGRMDKIIPLIIIVVAAALAFAAGAVLAHRQGYKQKGEVVARCRRGHLFTTVWVARFSIRRLDLGWAKIQRCPVGHHLSVVVPVDEATLTKEDKKAAKEYNDGAVGY